MMKPYSKLVISTRQRLSRNASKFAIEHVRPDIPPVDGEIYGKRSDENAAEWNHVYNLRLNGELKRLDLAFIPLARFET